MPDPPSDRLAPCHLLGPFLDREPVPLIGRLGPPGGRIVAAVRQSAIGHGRAIARRTERAGEFTTALDTGLVMRADVGHCNFCVIRKKSVEQRHESAP